MTQDEIADMVLYTITDNLDSYILKLTRMVEQDIKKAVYNYIGINDTSYEPSIKKGSLLEERIEKKITEVLNAAIKNLDVNDIKLTAIAKKRILKEAQSFLESQILITLKNKIANGPQSIAELDIKIGEIITKRTQLLEALINAKH